MPALSFAKNPVMSHSYDVEEADFEELVIARSHEVPVLVDIGAEWCSPCRVLTPRLEKLAADYAGAFLLARVDADENMRIAGRHGVRGFPTVIAYCRGAEVARFHSNQSEGFLRQFIDDAIGRHATPTSDTAPQPA
jgi:putative thioredoxin